MTVSIKTGGIFTPPKKGDRPGLYVRFIQKAIAAIGTGARSKVGTIKTNITGGTAAPSKVYRVKNTAEAGDLFGTANVADIGYMFMGGASEVVVVTTTATPDTVAYQKALQQLETQEFHVFACPPGAADTLRTEVYTWTKANRDEGKNFISVFSNATKEGDAVATKAAAIAYLDEYCVFVANGVKDASGNIIDADSYACYMAGLIAGTALDGSLTYYEVPFAETITRFRSPDIKTLLEAGTVVTVMDGGQPRIEQGLTLDGKIRIVRAKQAMIDDIASAVADNYIGKITNSPDGQIAVLNAIKAYLETLANGNVIDRNYVVELDKVNPSTGSSMFVNIGVQFLDSIEFVYLTVTL